MVRVVDMGMHVLPSLPGLHLIVQLLVPGLEERAHHLPPLHSTQHTPGMSASGSVFMFLVCICSACTNEP